MILEILKLINAVTGAAGFFVGTRVVVDILARKPLHRWPIVFLKCALIASATGLLLSFHQLDPAHWAAMSSVYVAGAAILALRRYRLSGIWSLFFELSIMLVLYLNIVVGIAHLFEMLIPAQPKSLFLITELMVMLLFAGFGLFAVRRYRNPPVRLTARSQVNGCN